MTTGTEYGKKQDQKKGAYIQRKVHKTFTQNFYTKLTYKKKKRPMESERQHSSTAFAMHAAYPQGNWFDS